MQLESPKDTTFMPAAEYKADAQRANPLVSWLLPCFSAESFVKRKPAEPHPAKGTEEAFNTNTVKDVGLRTPPQLLSDPPPLKTSPAQAGTSQAALLQSCQGSFQPSQPGSINKTSSLLEGLSASSVSSSTEQHAVHNSGAANDDKGYLQAQLALEVVPRPGSIQLHQLNREVKRLQPIGHGAGGVVYRGLWNGIAVAIKFMLSSSPGQLNQSAREAIFSRFISHPNVVQTFTYDVTLLVEGTTAPPSAVIQSCDHNESLNIFDICSRSLNWGHDVQGALCCESSNLTDPEGSSAVAVGWGTHDVLMRLGAVPGQYLTHIIMELCDGGTLQQAIHQAHFSGSQQQSDRTKCKALLRTALDIARGMAHLHGLGVVHGDLKPSNVLLRQAPGDKRGFIAKVADFGLARQCSPDKPGSLQALEPLGTLCYSAPEALRGTLHKSSDVYSFGTLLWQLCSGQVPFQGLHAAHVMFGKHNGSLTLQWPQDTYSPIRKLGALCMETDPGARPSFEQVCKALVKIEQSLRQAQVPAASQPPTAQLPTAQPSTTNTKHAGSTAPSDPQPQANAAAADKAQLAAAAAAAPAHMAAANSLANGSVSTASKLAAAPASATPASAAAAPAAPAAPAAAPANAFSVAAVTSASGTSAGISMSVRDGSAGHGVANHHAHSMSDDWLQGSDSRTSATVGPAYRFELLPDPEME